MKELPECWVSRIKAGPKALGKEKSLGLTEVEPGSLALRLRAGRHYTVQLSLYIMSVNKWLIIFSRIICVSHINPKTGPECRRATVRQKLGTGRHCALCYQTVLRVTIHVWIVVVTGQMKTSSIPTAITLYPVDIHDNKRMQSGA